jgi:hypothetical protein
MWYFVALRGILKYDLSAVIRAEDPKAQVQAMREPLAAAGTARYQGR